MDNRYYYQSLTGNYPEHDTVAVWLTADGTQLELYREATDNEIDRYKLIYIGCGSSLAKVLSRHANT